MVLVSRRWWLSVCVVARDNHCTLQGCAKREATDDVRRKRQATTPRPGFDKDESNEIKHGNGCNLCEKKENKIRKDINCSQCSIIYCISFCDASYDDTTKNHSKNTKQNKGNKQNKMGSKLIY